MDKSSFMHSYNVENHEKQRVRVREKERERERVLTQSTRMRILAANIAGPLHHDKVILMKGKNGG